MGIVASKAIGKKQPILCRGSFQWDAQTVHKLRIVSLEPVNELLKDQMSMYSDVTIDVLLSRAVSNQCLVSISGDIWQFYFVVENVK